MKFIIFILFLIITIMATTLLSEEKYKEPSFKLIESKNNIEIREYGQYIVAKTTIKPEKVELENNMFRVLASYIFGGNEQNQSIPMTAPVTTFEDENSYNMLFYMLNSDDISDLPKPLDQNITFENFILGKCAVISFSWFVNDKKINKYQNKLKKFLKDNNYTQQSPFMLNRYDSPWKLPFMRRNEVLVKIQ